MGSVIDSLLAADLPGILADVGRAAVYVDQRGEGTDLAGLLMQQTNRGVDRFTSRHQRSDSDARVRTATAVVAASELATPEIGGVVTCENQSWTVTAVEPMAGGGAWRLHLQTSTIEHKRTGDYLRGTL